MTIGRDNLQFWLDRIENGEIINDIPGFFAQIDQQGLSADQLHKLYLATVSKYPLLIAHIPLEKRDLKICVAGIYQTPAALPYVPDDLVDRDEFKPALKYCFDLIPHFPPALLWLPAKFVTQEFCNTTVKARLDSLSFIPKPYRTYELFKSTITDNKNSAQVLPFLHDYQNNTMLTEAEYKNLLLEIFENNKVAAILIAAPPTMHFELCLERVRNGWKLGVIIQRMEELGLNFTDEQYRELGQTAIRQSALALVDVPEKFRDYPMCLECVSKDPYAISAIGEYPASNLTEAEYSHLCSIAVSAINGSIYTEASDREMLGSGGCKSIYPLNDGQHVYASITPELEIAGRKRIIEEEFRMANRVRQEGLLTQDYSLALVKLRAKSRFEGLQFVTLVMTSFSHLAEKQGIHIIDLKNISPQAKEKLRKAKDLPEEDVTSRINADIVSMISSGIKFRYDSINLAFVDDGKQPPHLRIFLFDFADKAHLLDETLFRLIDIDGEPATEEISRLIKNDLKSTYTEIYGNEKAGQLEEKFSQQLTDKVIANLKAIPLDERRKKFLDPYLAKDTKFFTDLIQHREAAVTEIKNFLDSPSEDYKTKLTEAYIWWRKQDKVGPNYTTPIDYLFNMYKESLTKDEIPDFSAKMLHHFPQFKAEITKTFGEVSSQKIAEDMAAIRKRERFLSAQDITEVQEQKPSQPASGYNRDSGK